MLVGSFNLSQSFNYMPYLFYKKWFKSEINSFCIWTLKHADKHIEEILEGKKEKNHKLSWM
jgi:hypothetical protein